MEAHNPDGILRHTAFPAHGSQKVPWRQKQRGGIREDRMLSSVDAAVPPLIRNIDYLPPKETMMLMEQALIAVTQADRNAGGHSAASSRFMIRSESVASSRIERIAASAEDYAKAIAGNKSNSSAVSMVAASTALHQLISDVAQRGEFHLDDLLAAHSRLMIDDPEESAYAGQMRDMQNWIGGSHYSPRDALYVPPVPETVSEYLEDLIAYLNRDDVPVMVQAAIGHAQFESIHAFTDGNGRIGRALVSAVLRRRGVTAHSVVPLASGLLAQRDEYFASLGAYRKGNPEPVVNLFSRSARVAAECAHLTTRRLIGMPDEWREVMKPRAGSATAKLIAAFYDYPVMTSDEAMTRSGASEPQTNQALVKLAESGLISEITGRKKDRVWAASEVLAELDELDRRIAQRMTQ